MMLFSYRITVICFLSALCAACNGKSSKDESEMKVVHVKTVPFGRFSSAFGDLNDKHMKAAEENGVDVVSSREDAKKRGSKLQEIQTCKYYKVDPLTHSIPYLVPKAVDLLETIGENFIDLLDERGGDGYKIIVTSVLRAETDVKKLRRRNGNASENSAHRFGTTFDVAYTRFEHASSGVRVPEAELKHLLGEVLNKLRKENKCYVKYEIKQGCFHITVR